LQEALANPVREILVGPASTTRRSGRSVRSRARVEGRSKNADVFAECIALHADADAVRVDLVGQSADLTATGRTSVVGISHWAGPAGPTDEVGLGRAGTDPV
jgi:hypothetical protein